MHSLEKIQKNINLQLIKRVGFGRTPLEGWVGGKNSYFLTKKKKCMCLPKKKLNETKYLCKGQGGE